jgi:hypothetical protein
MTSHQMELVEKSYDLVVASVAERSAKGIGPLSR